MSRAVRILALLLWVASAGATPEGVERWNTWLPRTNSALEIGTTGTSTFPEARALLKLRRDQAWLERWASAAPSIGWNDVVAGQVIKYQQNPLRAARVYSYVHISIHDALVECARRGCEESVRPIAMHRAASVVLAHLYPSEATGRMEALGHSASTAVLAHQGEHPQAELAWATGSAVAASAIRRALDDGWDQPRLPAVRPAPGPGVWRASPPLNFYDPVEPNAAKWRTWVVKDGSEIEPPPPVTFGTPAYWAEVREVYEVTKTLTLDQRKIAEDWNLDLGSVTPGGVWNQHARALAISQKMDAARTALLFATLNAAMADAFIACWHAKFKWWTARPVTMIREQIDPSYLPPIITPPFPSYVSGHSSASGAAAAVLSAFVPQERGRLTQMAEEAAVSRLYGGIHFRSDNEAGLDLGRRIGERANARVDPAALAAQSAATVR